MGCAATKEEDDPNGYGDGGGSSFYSCFHPNKPLLKSPEALDKQKEEFHDQYQSLLTRIATYKKGNTID